MGGNREDSRTGVVGLDEQRRLPSYGSSHTSEANRPVTDARR
jgi:hypothetical protein